MPDITLPPRKSRVYLPTVIFDVSATVDIPPIVLQKSFCTDDQKF
jgi:hypothetical protein